MTTIVKNYPVFEANQVLTHNQLNNLANYLDQQNRLTRVKLIGMGIVCGLELVCDEATDTLQITKGVGVTSEGFLVTVGDNCILTRYRDYEKPESIEYAPFDDAGDITIYELLTDRAEVGANDEVEDITKDFLSDKVIMLYVECFDNDLKSCLGKSCDQLGVDRIINIRKLAVSRDDALRIKAMTPSDDLVNKSYNLPDIPLPRVIFNPNKNPSHYYPDFAEQYLTALQGAYNQLLYNAPQTYWDCLPILGDIYSENPFEDPAILNQQTRWQNYLAGAELSGVSYMGIQSFYDYVKDLLLTYHEFKAVICDLFAVCCPDMDAFPKHLFLGEVNPFEDLGDGYLMDDCRQEFLQAPIYNKYKYELEKARNLHQRLVLQLELFNLRVFESGDKQGITPSCEKKEPLGKRSIPFYYDLNTSSRIIDGQSLEAVWDYEACRTNNFYGNFNNNSGVLSYERNTMGNQLLDPQSTPLLYDIDPYEFYRIEGHLGKPVDEARSFLEKFKGQYNLDFDVQTLYLGDEYNDDLRRQLAACLCRDLQLNYAIWRHKLLFFLNNIVRLTYRSRDVVLNSSAYLSASQKPFESNDSEGDSQENAAARFFRNMTNPEMRTKANNISRMAEESENISSESALRLISFIDDINGISTRSKNTKSSRYLRASTRDNLSLIDQLNDCLVNLIAATREDIKDMSDLSNWLEAYKCILQINIDNMKLRAENSFTFAEALQAWLINFILCLVHRLLQAIAIHPYINMRMLVDTLNTRIERLEQMEKFSNKLRQHPGLEHQAGVKPGGTFFLLYQLPHEFDDPKDEQVNEVVLESEAVLIAQEQAQALEEVMRDLQKLKAVTAASSAAAAKSAGKTAARTKATKSAGADKTAESRQGEALSLIANLEKRIRGLRTNPETTSAEQEEIKRVSEVLNGRVIGDFSLPYLCCDDCADLPADVVSLDPLATPKCGVVSFRQRPDVPQYDANGEAIDPNFPEDFEYIDLEMQLLNNLYDPNIYEVRITEDPKLGTYGFFSEVYEPRPSINKQMLRYTATPAAVKSESQNIDRLLVVDEMRYEIYDRQRDEVVDSSTITIFIFVLDFEERPTVCLGGQVFEVIDNQQRPINNAKVNIENLGIDQFTNDAGTYQFDDIPAGEHTLSVEPPTGYISTERVVSDFTSDNKKINFEVTRIVNIIPEVFYEVLDIPLQSTQAIELEQYYVGNFNEYQSASAKLIDPKAQDGDPVIRQVAKTVAQITSDQKLTTKDLNAQFVRERDVLVQNLDKGVGRVTDQKNALKTLTLSYLDRMATLQEGQTSEETIGVLKNTTKVYNSSDNVRLKTTISTWMRERKGRASEDYLAAVNKNLVLT